MAAVNTHKTFALLGVGSVGSFVTEELLKAQVDIKILTRDSNKPSLQTFKDRGVRVLAMDYSSQEQLIQAFTGIDVVVSMVSQGGIAAQVDYIKAAKAAGVKLFVPAEFGFQLLVGPNAPKQTVRNTLEAVGLPYALFFTGFFTDELAHYVQYNFKEGHMRIVGKGDTAFAVTARQDIGRFVAHVLTTVSSAELEWNKFPMAGDRMSPLQLKSFAENKLNKKIEVRYVDYEENKAAAATGTDFLAFLSQAIEDGDAVSGSEQDVKECIAKYFPHWNPLPIDSFIVE